MGEAYRENENTEHDTFQQNPPSNIYGMGCCGGGLGGERNVVLDFNEIMDV